MEHLIAVARTKYMRAVDGPENDWRPPEGTHLFEGRRNVQAFACFEVVPLLTALNDTYSTDEHLVAYVMHRDGQRVPFQPRVAKDGLEYVRSQGFELFANVVVLDVDNDVPADSEKERHAPWTPELVTEAEARYARWRADGTLTWGIYHTSKGARFVQPLDRWIPIHQFEYQMRAFYERVMALHREGERWRPDERCKDWTRHFRLPNVVRDGKDYRSPLVDFASMRPVTPADPPAMPTSEPPIRERPRRPRAEPPTSFHD